MRVGGKIAPKRRSGDEEADRILQHYHAAKKLEKTRAKDPAWQLAAAAAGDRRLLIGNCKIFRSPR